MVDPLVLGWPTERKDEAQGAAVGVGLGGWWTRRAVYCLLVTCSARTYESSRDGLRSELRR